MERWLKISIILVVAGSIVLVLNQVLYLSRYMAFLEAFRSFAENHAVGSPPTLEECGLATTSVYVGVILGYAAGICVFIGVAYLIIGFIGKIVKRLGAPFG